jgi:hypothetical protein
VPPRRVRVGRQDGDMDYDKEKNGSERGSRGGPEQIAMQPRE